MITSPNEKDKERSDQTFVRSQLKLYLIHIKLLFRRGKVRNEVEQVVDTTAKNNGTNVTKMKAKTDEEYSMLYYCSGESGDL